MGAFGATSVVGVNLHTRQNKMAGRVNSGHITLARTVENLAFALRNKSTEYEDLKSKQGKINNFLRDDG